jgi:hypothetical protein
MIPHKAMTDQEHDDLDWQAFRYISAEMPPDEVAQFEEQLSTDQRSRESVARAVELAEALAVVITDRSSDMDQRLAQPIRRAELAWWSRIGWIGVGAAATLACVLLFQTIWGAAQPNATVREQLGKPAGGPAIDDPQAVELALLWSHTRDETSLTSDDMGSAGLADAPFDELDESISAGREDAAEVPDPTGGTGDLADSQTDPIETAPSWLLAAVASELESSDDDGLLRPED